jgi:hypothetical protein
VQDPCVQVDAEVGGEDEGEPAPGLVVLAFVRQEVEADEG